MGAAQDLAWECTSSEGEDTVDTELEPARVAGTDEGREFVPLSSGVAQDEGLGVEPGAGEAKELGWAAGAYAGS